MPGKDGPPYAIMPSYITEFQSSPVRILSQRDNVVLIKTEAGNGIRKKQKRRSQRCYLKHGEQGLRKVVKGAAPCLVKVELSPKELHAQQGENNDEEEEQEQQGGDGSNGVEEGSHQVGQRVPISKEDTTSYHLIFYKKVPINIFLVELTWLS